ncbi:hypothetical protein GJ496_003152 [Pomphorhynchus laevis]|nr:hypothetical protein GJ496_003152 [Pomphorhynchus laevis]
MDKSDFDHNKSHNTTDNDSSSPIVEYIYRFKKSKREDGHHKLNLLNENFSSTCKVFLPCMDVVDMSRYVSDGNKLYQVSNSKAEEDLTFYRPHKSTKSKLKRYKDVRYRQHSLNQEIENNNNYDLQSGYFNLTNSRIMHKSTTRLRDGCCKSAGSQYKKTNVGHKSRWDLSMEENVKPTKRWNSANLKNEWRHNCSILDAIRDAPPLGFENSSYKPRVINLPDIYLGQDFMNQETVYYPTLYSPHQQYTSQNSSMYIPNNNIQYSSLIPHPHTCSMHSKGMFFQQYT